jgi:hypothetical protein
MNVLIIDGYLGAGKTLAMTILADYFRSRSGCALYSNYGIRGSKEFSHYTHFLDVANETSSIITLDEAHTDLDSRNFNTNAVKFFTHLVFYFRKLRTTLFLATPSIDNLDSRVRSICNLYCKVTKDKNYFYYTMYDLQRLKFLKRYKIPQAKAFRLAGTLYDTYNMVLPVEFPTERKEFNEFVKELKQTSEQFYVSGAGQGTPSLEQATDEKELEGIGA